jgi:hypothetical protein
MIPQKVKSGGLHSYNDFKSHFRVQNVEALAIPENPKYIPAVASEKDPRLVEILILVRPRR